MSQVYKKLKHVRWWILHQQSTEHTWPPGKKKSFVYAICPPCDPFDSVSVSLSTHPTPLNSVLDNGWFKWINWTVGFLQLWTCCVLELSERKQPHRDLVGNLSAVMIGIICAANKHFSQLFGSKWSNSQASALKTDCSFSNRKLAQKLTKWFYIASYFSLGLFGRGTDHFLVFS